MDEQFQKAIAAGDLETATRLINLLRPRLKSLVRLRLAAQLQSRVDDSDVVQEAISEAANNLSSFDPDVSSSIYVWVRKYALIKLAELTRYHVSTQKRSVLREVAQPEPEEDETSRILADRLASDISTPSSIVAKAEINLRLHEGLSLLDPIDREILILRHFEGMSLSECSEVVGISKAGAGKRYLKAIERLKKLLQQVDELVLNADYH